MHHRRGAHGRAEIGRTGGEVPQGRRERVVEVILQGGIQLSDRVPSLLQLEPGTEHLNPQVVLFVDHHRKSLVLADHDARATFRAAEFAADQVALDEDLFLEVAELAHRDIERTLHRRGRGDGLATNPENLLALGGFGPAGKSRAREIPREANPRHQHNSGFAAGGVRQLGGAVDERCNSHGLNARTSGWTGWFV